MKHEKRGYTPGTIRQLYPLFFMIFLSSIPCSLRSQEILPQIKVSVNARNQSINHLLDEITLQSGYYFTYNADLIPGNKRVSLKVSNLTIQETLDSLLGDPGFAYRVIDRNIVIYRKNTSAAVPLNEEIDRSMVSGLVLDSRTDKPLGFATIGLYGSSLGSITNQSGNFSFKIPTDLANPMLVISYMGYKQRFVPVTYPMPEEIVIKLERETIPLQEVIIRFTEPELLLKESLKRIPENYLDDFSTMTAFYRESINRDQHSMMYSEAILDLAKSPYFRSAVKDQVRIRKGRKITDVSMEDTVAIKLRSGIYTCLSLDVIREKPDFLEYDFFTRYTLEFNDIMTYGNNLVYVISFQQRPNISELLFRGQLYLDQESLAIVAADFEYNPNRIHKEPGLFLVKRSPSINIRPLLAKYHVDYKLNEGRYHVSQVRAEVEMKVRKRRQWIGARYRITIEMVITDVIQHQRLRINPAERLKPSSILSDEPFHYDPLFWGKHNTIEPEASLMESLRNIEHRLQEINE